MRKKLLHDTLRENGNVIILFAGTLVVLIFFIGLSLDIGMICMRRNYMQNLCQMIREVRFTYQDTIRYADNPALTSYDLIYETAEQNDFNGTVKVYFYEEIPQQNYRYYRIRTELSEDYSYIFARIFGLSSSTITVTLDGGETYGEGMSDVVWYPQADVSAYNGSYTSQADGGYVYDSGDIPADW